VLGRSARDEQLDAVDRQRADTPTCLGDDGDDGRTCSESDHHHAREHAGVRAVVQRVIEATVSVVADGHGEEVGRIGPGLCVLLGVTHTDDTTDAAWLAAKLWHLRVFDDDAGVMNRSAADVGGEILVVSQFTVYGETSGGRRPSWIAAARPDVAEPLVEAVVDALRALGATVATGRFRTEMQVALVNDGPVTVIIER